MIWQSWIEGVAAALGIGDLAVVGIIVSLVVTIATITIILMAGKGSGGFHVTLAGFSCIILFTVFGWMPYWILLILTLLAAGMLALRLRDWFGGGGEAQE